MTYLQIGHNGGIFQIDPQLIQLIKFLIDDGRSMHPILDFNENPIMIEDLEEFYTKITGRYSEALNEYYFDYEKLKQARDTKAVIDV